MTKDDSGDDDLILPRKRSSHRGKHPPFHVSGEVGCVFMVIRLRLYLLALRLPDESALDMPIRKLCLMFLIKRLASTKRRRLTQAYGTRKHGCDHSYVCVYVKSGWGSVTYWNKEHYFNYSTSTNIQHCFPVPLIFHDNHNSSWDKWGLYELTANYSSSMTEYQSRMLSGCL